MPYICDHIAVLIKNSAEALCKNVSVFINESRGTDIFEIIVTDDGIGMDCRDVRSALNPFFSSKGKKTGLGLSLFGFSVAQAGGELFINSEPGYGAVIRAVIPFGALDREPLGNISACLCRLMSEYPQIRFVYEHRADDSGFCIDCGKLKDRLAQSGVVGASAAAVIASYIKNGERLILNPPLNPPR